MSAFSKPTTSFLSLRSGPFTQDSAIKPETGPLDKWINWPQRHKTTAILKRFALRGRPGICIFSGGRGHPGRRGLPASPHPAPLLPSRPRPSGAALRPCAGPGPHTASSVHPGAREGRGLLLNSQSLFPATKTRHPHTSCPETSMVTWAFPARSPPAPSPKNLQYR